MARPINQNTVDTAMRIVGEFGIKRLDNLGDYERVYHLKNFARQLRDETGVTYYTSRQHIARACRKLRHEEIKKKSP